MCVCVCVCVRACVRACVRVCLGWRAGRCSFSQPLINFNDGKHICTNCSTHSTVTSCPIPHERKEPSKLDMN